MKKSFKPLLTIALVFLFSTTAHASSLAVPNYEVKFLMNTSSILDSSANLSNKVISTFNISSYKNLNVEYLDTNNLDLNKEGWIVRLRKFDGDDSTKLTYKKRYTISNGNIDTALETAADDGFDGDNDNYSAQIDWGYETQTLNFSDNKQFSLYNYSGIELPNNEDAIKEAIYNIPGKLNKWLYPGWAQEQLNSAVLYGPYLGKRYIGQLNGLKIELETYNVNNNYIAEISFKTDKYEDASNQRQQLLNLLDSNGWLVKSDESKTGIMLGE